MIVKPGCLYQVAISDRGSGTVKAVRKCINGMVDSVIMHGKFKNRVPNCQVRIDGDFLCFRLHDDTVTIKPLELKD